VIHELPLEQRTLRGRFSRDFEPVLTIDPGDSVRVDVPNAGWWLESRERFVPRDEAEYAGHALAGPIAVRGARAGMTLVVRIDEVSPGSWGATMTRPPHWLEWALAGGVARCGPYEVPLRPFFGVLGMPPPEPGLHSTTPPRPWGGNIDCKELVAGTTLFLPVPVDGALFSAGDPHGAQGDGEVSGTAIECGAQGQVTLDLREDLPLDWPVARIDGAWLTFGFADELGKAAEIATESMLDLIEREHAISRLDALALASLVVDLRVTQVVNGVLGVHAVLADGAI
jgi:acetamidase/formamidase